MSESEEPVFEVDYECENCGNCWAEKYCTQTKIEKGRIYGKKNFVEVKMPNHYSEKEGNVKCGNCELEEGVSIQDRNPIE